jgi:hypothetical protein
MNKMIIEILDIQNQLLEDIVNTWDPKKKEKLERAKELVNILQNGVPNENPAMPASVKKRINPRSFND